MEKFSRSKSSIERGTQKKQPNGMNDLRSYSTCDYNPDYCYSWKEMKMKKGNNKSRVMTASSSSRNWSLSSDPELQRRKRVAGYKAYGMEGRMKSSLRNSFKWIKDKVVHGFW